MDLDTRIEYCLQSAMSMTAAQLYDKYVTPYRVRRQAKTSEDLARDAFQAGTVVNQKIVELFSLALKNLIGVKGDFGPMGVEGFLKQHATGKKQRDRERRTSMVTRRERGRRTACSPKNRRTATTVPTKRTMVKATDFLVTSENFDGPPGTWIECTRCKKWRFEPDVRDPSEILENWRCCLQRKLAHLQPSAGLEEAACAEPEDAAAKFPEQSYLFNEFTAGSIVLAKMQGFPWWPAMVDLDASGRYARFDPKTHIATHYNVVFLDPCKSTTKLLPASSLCKFTQMDKADVIRKAGRHSKKVAAAFQEAEEALQVSIEDRVRVFGYPHITPSSTKKNAVSPPESRPSKHVDFPRVALSKVRERCKFRRRTEQKMSPIILNEILHCNPSPQISCSTTTLDLAQCVDKKPKESAVFETRMDNEKVGTAEVKIDELMTTVLYDTQDWSPEQMYRAFMPHRYCPLSPIDRTEHTPEVAAEAPLYSTASPILTKSEPAMANEDPQFDDDLGALRHLPEGGVPTPPLPDFSPVDCISSPQHSPRTNNLVPPSTRIVARQAISAPDPVSLLSVLKTQATAKAQLMQAIGQFITNIPFHLQLSAAKPQPQDQ